MERKILIAKLDIPRNEYRNLRKRLPSSKLYGRIKHNIDKQEEKQCKIRHLYNTLSGICPTTDNTGRDWQMTLNT